MDEMLSFGLLVCGKDETRDVVAAREAKRIKKCLGALRSLYRSSVLLQWVAGGMHNMHFCIVEDLLSKLCVRIKSYRHLRCLR